MVPLRPAHKPIPYEDSKRICQSNQIGNEIPIDIRELPTINRFKKTYKGVVEELTENINLKTRPLEEHDYKLFVLFLLYIYLFVLG